jgi:putative acetyltransferase
MYQPGDAEQILKTHGAAVRITAAKDYPEDVIQSWASPATPEKIEEYSKRIERGEETTVVAVLSGKIVGFGAIVEEENELRAVYVSPDANRMGVGSAILAKLEQIAKERGLTELQMHSSLTAEPFYLTHGYRSEGRSVHTLRNGQEMACVLMRKTF